MIILKQCLYFAFLGLRYLPFFFRFFSSGHTCVWQLFCVYAKQVMTVEVRTVCKHQATVFDERLSNVSQSVIFQR